MDFLKQNKRFSFMIGGKNAWDTDYTDKIVETKTENVHEQIVDYYFESGLKVTNRAKKYKDFGAYEWVNEFVNTSDRSTEVLSELWDCDCALSMEHEEPRKWEAFFPDKNSVTKIYAPNGSIWGAKEFYCNVDEMFDNHCDCHIFVGDTRNYSTSGGRSSQAHAPFFDISKNGKGYIVAIGWTGQWNCSISRESDSVTVRSKIEDTHFRLLSGEKIRTSSILIMPYDGSILEGHNKFRRLLKEHFSLIGQEGRDSHGPLCAGIWGGMESSLIIERIKKIRENRLPFEYLWIDAGWYGADTRPTPDEFEGDWSCHTGDWRVSPLIHPQGLKDVSKAAHDADMKLLLWFEPERVIRQTPIVSEHPEYFLYEGDSDHLLLDLGREDAWRYCYNMLSGHIRSIGIDCYRNDFNIDPLSRWQQNDPQDRHGITEIKYINGLYRLWDTLLTEFPHLLIDNCASGGRRIDIEMLRRSVPLWRSDMMCPANYEIEAAQIHNQTFNAWVPYSGTGSGRLFDEYRVRSSYAASLTTNYSFSARNGFCENEEQIAFIRKYTEEYLRVRPYFSEDFYPLTDVSDSLDTWCAMQFDRPSRKDGMILVYRRENSPYPTIILSPCAIDETAEYRFTDTDGNFCVNISGRELSKSGLPFSAEKRSAKILLYTRVEKGETR